MQFKITGRIREKESGLGVRGLMVRAYDKDLLYDDLLGTALTNEEGRFEMVYSEKDFRELFECKPDIYLSIYAPPYRFLVDTKDAIRWEAGTEEHFELEIEREILGDMAPSRPDDQVEGGISLPAGVLHIEKRDNFDIPKLPSFRTGGIPGAPALPEQTQYVALPIGGDVLSLEVIPGDPIRLPGKVNPLPAQAPVPDVGIDPNQFSDGFSIENVHVAFTPLDSKYVEHQHPYPEKLVELDKVEEIGAIQIATVRVRPLQYDPSQQAFIFYPNLRYAAKFDLEKAKQLAEQRDRKETTVGQYYTEIVNSLLQSNLVVSAKDLRWPKLILLEEVPYVIITDNYTWPEAIALGDGTTRAPNLSERGVALAGNLVSEFERLAKWKTARGVRTRVVTVSDIVSGEFGDFTQGGFARDLQEVLRNFIKSIQKNWKTLYLLLAGDVNVVPMRHLVGSSTYNTIGCWRHPDNPPPEKIGSDYVSTCHFVSGKAVVKLRPMFTPASDDPLSTMHGAIRIPFNREAGSGYLGWYYTTETDFKTKDQGFSRLPIGQTSNYIIVEGPEAVLDDDYYWVREVNSIPSDFYYASLVGSGYSIPGKHDFDSNNNGLYGQSHWDSSVDQEVTLDAVSFYSDVWVGRASVESGDQARGFVNKVLTYERLETPNGEASVDVTYLQKILYASSYWGREFQGCQSDTATPPQEGMFTHVAGATMTKIRTKFDLTLSGSTPSHRLVSRRGTSNVVIPYNTAATATNLGWYFTTNDTYNTQSATPTRFVKVLGSETKINPEYFFWDPTGLELAVQEKENLRTLMNGWYPNFNSVERHYEDYFDLAAPPPIVPLEENTIRNALNNGAHFVSLSGHGWWGGCCGININDQPNFTNNRKYSIMFANSCSTAKPDGVDSLAEISTLDPNGGAVAYVGNTRYGWIGVGDNYEEFFWRKLKVLGNAGSAAGLRLATGGVRSLWTLYTQTLFGDPEMPVWTDAPKIHEVTHPASIALGNTVTVTVRYLGSPVANHRVTLMGGWSNSSTSPLVFMTKTTNSFGQASFSLPSSTPFVALLKVTVTYPNFKPYVGTITLTGGVPPVG
ncbi:MAG: C25 family cysteine peptidase [Microcystis sp. LE18-22.4A]|jgi:hypothetical protein|uniref:C25 family cysteine peptidase n=1 Tax=Microcystis sp. LE18-22.4A TaxID=3016432 RepID=UPI0022CCF2C0|nr:C25 family cysteine peptidase [Microcystis sp. LE18-22.4A]MCZ8121746.1 C25 family cysteine peptidase [Microcystis sp. LE18-22.4A]